ncbi:hypothetical protein SEA_REDWATTLEHOG_202 [Gordonia phage RedWattleHog]|uniref:Uncharacterized protein n=1 Tax=Gordonia phage Stormageddon TaxID=2656541 RepID=A0A649VU26_9CAUD|nr:hypothetical protein KHQ86_gp097 [Gordonia phage Stormageddon]QGJ95063.1 hypothetical protein SEA_STORMAGEDDON_203 [Gordonia phage Stormageddon]QLF83705.1 hypothetical protein SEA_REDWATTLEHOG_202 [Gordonia phage RedWattleHog]
MNPAQIAAYRAAALADFSDRDLLNELLSRVGQRVAQLPEVRVGEIDVDVNDAMMEAAIDLAAEMGVDADDVARPDPKPEMDIVVSAAELFYGLSALAGFDIVTI